jgi:hypothetical protein
VSYRVAATAVLALIASRVPGRDPAAWPDWTRCGLAFALTGLAFIAWRPLHAAAPAGRPKDLSRVANVMLVGRKDEAPGELHLSRLWLE